MESWPEVDVCWGNGGNYARNVGSFYHEVGVHVASKRCWLGMEGERIPMYVVVNDRNEPLHILHQDSHHQPISIKHYPIPTGTTVPLVR
jgi:hypothetical protein